MKVSIIIPAYNAEKTISKCLDSIINQTYQNLEIIIINDGSKDNTLDICQKYASIDKRIRLIDKPNSGVSNSRNMGIEKSTGDFITFVDSDDTLELSCIETLVNNVDSDTDFIRYNFNTIGKKTFHEDLYELKDRKIELKDHQRTIFTHFLTAKESIPNFVFLLFIKRILLKNIRFNTDLHMMEDVDFYFQIFSTANVGKFLDQKMYNYYNNPISVSHNPKNFIRNIYGVLKTNEVLNTKVGGIVEDDIILNMNASHLSVISNYLINICKNNKKESLEEINKLKTDKNFIRLLDNSNLKSIPLKNRISMTLIKNNKKLLLNIYYSTLRLLYKLKG